MPATDTLLRVISALDRSFSLLRMDELCVSGASGRSELGRAWPLLDSFPSSPRQETKASSAHPGAWRSVGCFLWKERKRRLAAGSKSADESS